MEQNSIDYKMLLKYNLPSYLERAIVEEDAGFQLTQTVLDKRYIKLMFNLTKTAWTTVQQNYKLFKAFDLQIFSTTAPKELGGYIETFETWKFLIIFVCCSVLRVKKDTNFPLEQFLKNIEIALEKSVALSIWLVESFSHPEILDEFFVTCPLSFPRFFIVSILLVACKCLLAGERKKILKLVCDPEAFHRYILKRGGVETSNLAKDAVYLLPEVHHNLPFILILITNAMTMLPKLIEKRKQMQELAYLFSELSRLDPLLRKFMLNSNIFGCIFEIITENISQFTLSLSLKRKIMLQKSTYALGFQKAVTQKVVSGKKVQGNANKSENLSKRFRFLLDLFSQVIKII